MAYVTSNPPAKVSQGPLASVNSNQGVGGNLWVYRSADSDATVYAAGYFSNAAALGMQVGDLVIVLVAAAGTVTDAYLHIVTAINATTGAATLSSTTVTHLN